MLTPESLTCFLSITWPIAIDQFEINITVLLFVKLDYDFPVDRIWINLDTGELIFLLQIHHLYDRVNEVPFRVDAFDAKYISPTSVLEGLY